MAQFFGTTKMHRWLAIISLNSVQMVLTTLENHWPKGHSSWQLAVVRHTKESRKWGIALVSISNVRHFCGLMYVVYCMLIGDISVRGVMSAQCAILDIDSWLCCKFSAYSWLTVNSLTNCLTAKSVCTVPAGIVE